MCCFEDTNVWRSASITSHMFTMAKIRDGSTYLDNHLRANDYYAEGESVVGRWHGRLAPRLGIQLGETINAGDHAFQMLRANLNPATGEKLTQRHVENRIPFYDFQCSAQKSVSVLHALCGDERLRNAHARALAVAFAELESLAACRVRQGDAAWSQDTRLTGNLCAARFRHDASRSLDPQLHDHLVIANATWDEKTQRIVGLETCEMLKAIRYCSKVYQNTLACEVQALGYRIVHSRNAKGVVEGFEIAGVPTDVCRRFSKRRKEVEDGIATFHKERGRAPSAAEVAVISRRTRSEKMAEISTPAVRATQLAQVSADELQHLRSITAAARLRSSTMTKRQENALSLGEMTNEQIALKHAVAHRFERASVLQGHDILAEALNAGLGTVDLHALKREVHAGSAGLILLEADQVQSISSGRFATAHGVRLERWSVDFVNRTKGRWSPLLSGRVTMADWLADEQKEAIHFVPCSRDQVMAVRGVAGAGKTTLLRELDAHLSQANKKMLYLAPTAAAVQVLRSEGFADAITIAEYLVRSQEQVPAQWREAVVVVDEAGLSSNIQGARLLELAEAADQRLVFVGDSRQHASVEAGDFLRVLETHSQLSTCELRDIRRQEVGAYNQAVRLLAQGQAAAGMERLDTLGWVQEAQADYLQRAADEYLRLIENTVGPKEKVLCVAPTWAENHVLTAHIRAGMDAQGQLGESRKLFVLDPLGWTVQQRRTVGNYRPGLVVTFNRKVPGFDKGDSVEIVKTERSQVILEGGGTLDLRKALCFDVATWREIDVAVGDKLLLRANDKEAGLINGEILTVAGFGADGSIKTTEGKLVPPHYRHFTHGYAVTSHKSQGRTVDHVVVAAARLDNKAAYVACSRGRRSCAVFTPDKVQLFAGLARSTERQAVLDVLAEQEEERKRRKAAARQHARSAAMAQVEKDESAEAETVISVPTEPTVVIQEPIVEPRRQGKRR